MGSAQAQLHQLHSTLMNLALVLLLITLGACDGDSRSPGADIDPFWLETSLPLQYPVHAVSLAPPERLGDEFSLLLAPQRTSADNGYGSFNPQWNAGEPDFDGLAYAAYELNSNGATAYGELRFTWDAAATPDPADLWIGLADWPGSVWRWYQTADVNHIAYDPAIHENSGALLAVVLLTGDQACRLRSIGIGSVSSWVHTWGNEYGDCGWAVATDEAGNTFVAGRSYDPYSDPYIGVWKYNPGGTLQWSRHWTSGVGNHASCAATDSFGNVFITGNVTAGDGEDALLLLKYSSDGELLWQKAWDATGANLKEDIYGIVTDHTGSIYIGGYLYDTAASDAYALAVKLDASGNQTWSKSWGPGAEIIYGIGCDDESNLYMAGCSGTWGTSCLLLKLDSSGAAQWAQEYDIGTGSESFLGIAVAADGTSYSCGNTYSAGPDQDTCLAAFDANGNLLWQKAWSNPGMEGGDDIAISSDYNVHLIGWVFQTATKSDILHLALSPSGSLVAASAWCNTDTSGNDSALAVAGHPAGGICLAGDSRTQAGEWQDIACTLSDTAATITDRTAPSNDIAGTLVDLAGEAHEFSGVRDTGYGDGSNDMLVMRAAAE